MKRVQFLDTTLRDGDQTPGVNFNEHEKIQIAKQLEKWGVDVIEAGFPMASKGDFESVRAISASVKDVTVAALARCNKKDIDRAYEALKEAKHAQIHVFIATSPVHMAYKLKKTPDEVLASIREHVRYARTLFEKVQFSPEDATRTEKEFLLEAVQTAVDAGATIINVPDTVGYTTPDEYKEIFEYLIANVKTSAQVMYSSHCHDDLGMSVANALAAIEGGATRVEGTVNGIGERAGNTALEEVAVALHIRKNFYQRETGIVLAETKNTSDLVSRFAGLPVPKNKAIIGGNAYAHESGIHQDGVLKNPETYEIITPELVGIKKNALPLGKLSGRHAFVSKMEELGISLSEEEVLSAFEKFKDLADKKKEVTDSDLYALTSGATAHISDTYVLESLTLNYSSKGAQEATVAVMTPEKGLQTATGTGSGSIQAIFHALDRLFDVDVQLTSYGIEAVTRGIDAQAEVHVTVENQKTNRQINAIGIDFDVLKASASAYLQAIDVAIREGTF